MSIGIIVSLDKGKGQVGNGKRKRENEHREERKKSFQLRRVLSVEREARNASSVTAVSRQDMYRTLVKERD